MTAAAATGRAFAPYRGLAPFGDDELDALLFFGRERETEIVTANLIGARLTVLYGPSGVGKSSLLRAGVARRVRALGRRRAIGRGPDLACVVFSSWADAPLGALTQAIAAEVAPLVSPTAPLPPEGASLADVVEHWTALLDGDLCLVLDQLEEHFVYHGDETGPASLLGQLPGLVTRPRLRANVLLSLRDDELSRLDVLKAALPGVFANALRLDRLGRDAARAAVLGPVERWNDLGDPAERVDVEPELVDEVLDAAAVAGAPDRIEAPFLQLVMERLWDAEREQGSRLLRRRTLAGLGGAEAIVREHLGRALGTLDPAEQETAARMFEHLVTPSGTKIAHRAGDLAEFAHVPAGEAQPVLAALGRQRILRHVEDAGDAADRYEIFHDVLAQAVLDWRHRRELETERAAARRRQRRLLALAAGALAALAVVAAVALYAIAQRGEARDQARRAAASSLDAHALAGLGTDPELSLLLAVEAARREPARSTEDVLRRALVEARGRAVYRGHEDGVLAAGLSGGRVVTVDGAGTLRLFPPSSGRAASEESLGHRVRAAAFSTDGRVVVAARRQPVDAYDVATARRIRGFTEPRPIRAVATDGAGRTIATLSNDGRVAVHVPGRPVVALRPPFAATAVALDRSGTTVAAAGADRAAVWRLGTRRPAATILDRADVVGLALTPDGTVLATAGADGLVRLWGVPGGGLENVYVGPNVLSGVVFSPDGGTLAALGDAGGVRIVAADGGREIAVLAGHSDRVTTAMFGPGSRLLVTGSLDGTARLWDPGAAPELEVLARPSGCCAAVAPSPSGVLVASGRRAILYRDGVAARSFAHGARVTAVAAAPGAVVTGGADGRVRVWAPDGTPRTALRVEAPVTAVAAAGRLLAAADGGGRVRVWTTGGVPVSDFRERSAVAALALSADGELLATAGKDEIARIRAARSGRLLHVLRGHTHPITGAAFSPDGSTLATSSFDKDVRLWRVESGRLEHVLQAHFAVVSGVGFSPGGRWLVTAGPTTAGLWHADTGGFVAYLRGHHGRVVGAAFTPDGRGIVTASVDGTVRGYRCRICEGVDGLLALAGQRLAATGRTLPDAERDRYLRP